jgi:hypothetical protein
MRPLRASPRVVLAGAALVLSLAGCQSGPETITAEQIVLTDATGAPRVFLGVTEQGTGLLVQDAHGKIRAGLSLLPDDTAELSLGDGVHMRAVIASRGDRTFLVLRDAEGRDRARVVVLADGARIETIDAAGATGGAQIVPAPATPGQPAPR